VRPTFDPLTPKWREGRSILRLPCLTCIAIRTLVRDLQSLIYTDRQWEMFVNTSQMEFIVNLLTNINMNFTIMKSDATYKFQPSTAKLIRSY